MRTTVTLDPDVARKLRKRAQRLGASFKQTLNAMLRRGLSVQAGTRRTEARFRVKPHAGGFRPGIDAAKLNQLLDQLDADDFARKAGASR